MLGVAVGVSLTVVMILSALIITSEVMREETFVAVVEKCLCDWCNLFAPSSYQSVRCMGSCCCDNLCIAQVLSFLYNPHQWALRCTSTYMATFNILTQCPWRPTPEAVASNALQCVGDTDWILAKLHSQTIYKSWKLLPAETL